MYCDEEMFDLLNGEGKKTGEVMTRGEVHRTGALHGSVHIWIVRERLDGIEVLLQKRSDDKDSYPSCYDAAATGHIDSGEDTLSAAIREAGEELGLTLKPSELILLFKKRVSEDNIFRGKRFINNEITWVFLCVAEVGSMELDYEKEEISELRWFRLEELREALKGGEGFCIYPKELDEVISCGKDMGRF